MADVLHNTEWVLAYRNDLLTPIFEVFTWIGYTNFYLVFLPLGYWLWNKRKFTRLAVIVAASALTNAYLKDWIQDPRPNPIFSLDPRVSVEYALPSGHAQVSFAMWIWLAVEVRRWWMWVVSILMVAGICASRIYLGVHDLEDILVGLALGFVAVIIAAIVVRTDAERVGPIIGAAIMLAGQVAMFANWQHPYGPGVVNVFGGFCVAWLIGVWYEQERLNFQPPVGTVHQAVVAVLGTLVLIILFVSIKKIANIVDPDGFETLYIGAAFIAIYMTFLAPWMFKRLRLCA